MKKFKPVLFLITGLIIFVACQEAPRIQDNELYPCFKARDCQYRNKNNPERCFDDEKECRARERYIYCTKKENRWSIDNEQNCWDKLNSK